MERNGSSKTFVISLSRSLSKATTQRPSLNRVAVPVLPLRSCRPRPEIVTRAPAERAISSPVHQLELVGWLDQHQVCCGGLSSRRGSKPVRTRSLLARGGGSKSGQSGVADR